MNIHDVVGLITVALLLAGVLFGLWAFMLMRKEENRRNKEIERLIDECISRYNYYLTEGDIVHQHDELVRREMLEEVRERIGL